jgi:hypothetical protein
VVDQSSHVSVIISVDLTKRCRIVIVHRRAGMAVSDVFATHWTAIDGSGVC